LIGNYSECIYATKDAALGDAVALIPWLAEAMRTRSMWDNRRQRGRAPDNIGSLRDAQNEMSWNGLSPARCPRF
jgi:hypothetical protein